jgi:hypothetical protein
MSSQCAVHEAACQACLQGNIITWPSPFLSQSWDIDDKDTTSIACVANLSVATANNSVFENKGIDSIKSG